MTPGATGSCTAPREHERRPPSKPPNLPRPPKEPLTTTPTRPFLPPFRSNRLPPPTTTAGEPTCRASTAFPAFHIHRASRRPCYLRCYPQLHDPLPRCSESSSFRSKLARHITFVEPPPRPSPAAAARGEPECPIE